MGLLRGAGRAFERLVTDREINSFSHLALRCATSWVPSPVGRLLRMLLVCTPDAVTSTLRASTRHLLVPVVHVVGYVLDGMAYCFVPGTDARLLAVFLISMGSSVPLSTATRHNVAGILLLPLLVLSARWSTVPDVPCREQAGVRAHPAPTPESDKQMRSFALATPDQVQKQAQEPGAALENKVLEERATNTKLYRQFAKCQEQVAALTHENSRLVEALAAARQALAQAAQRDAVQLAEHRDQVPALTREHAHPKAEAREALAVQREKSHAEHGTACEDRTEAHNAAAVMRKCLDLDEELHKKASECSKLAALLEVSQAMVTELEGKLATERDDAKRRVESYAKAVGRPRDNHLQRLLRIGDHPLPREFAAKAGSELVVDGNKVTLLNYQNGAHEFHFDHIYDSASDQEVAATLQPYIEHAVDGGRSLIMTDGPSSSGKSHTLLCSDYAVALQVGRSLLERAGGICIRALELLYSETLVPLMTPAEQTRHGIEIEGTSYLVTSASSLQVILQHIDKNRTTSTTAMNKNSSRQHLLLTMEVKGREHLGSVVMLDVCGAERSDDLGPDADSDSTKHINVTRSEYRLALQKLRTPGGAYFPPKKAKLARAVLGVMKNITSGPHNGTTPPSWPMAVLITHVNRRHPPNLTHDPLWWSCHYATPQKP